MGDGKALQMGTSHELGQNFSRAFDISYQDATGTQQLCWTTSWGVSTRMMGGLIMAHGDDAGLRVPPRLAAVQAVVLVVKDDDEGTVGAAAAAAAPRAGRRRRARPPRRPRRDRVRSPGDRLGAQGRAAAHRGRPPGPGRGAGGGDPPRHGREGADGPGCDPRGGGGRCSRRSRPGMHDGALAERERRTVECTTVEETAAAAADGFARVPWALLDADALELLGRDALDRPLRADPRRRSARATWTTRTTSPSSPAPTDRGRRPRRVGSADATSRVLAYTGAVPVLREAWALPTPFLWAGRRPTPAGRPAADHDRTTGGADERDSRSGA